MFPTRLKQAPRIFALTLVITFISGANFFSVLLFWPTQAFNVYGHDPVGVGIRGLPIGFSILAGAVIVLWLLSVLRGHNRELLIASSVIMTAGKSAFLSTSIHFPNHFLRHRWSRFAQSRYPLSRLGSPHSRWPGHRRHRRPRLNHDNDYLP